MGISMQELRSRLMKCVGESESNVEKAHFDADDALLEYIDDERVTELFDAIDKWYA